MDLRIPLDEAYVDRYNEIYGDNYAEADKGIMFWNPQQFIELADYASRLASVIERRDLADPDILWPLAFAELLEEFEWERDPYAELFMGTNRHRYTTICGPDSLAAISDVYRASDWCVTYFGNSSWDKDLKDKPFLNPGGAPYSVSDNLYEHYRCPRPWNAGYIPKVLRFASQCLRDAVDNWEHRNKDWDIHESREEDGSSTEYPNYERNKWIHKQACKKPLKTWPEITEELKKQRFDCNCMSVRAVQDVARTIANLPKFSPIPRRSRGRKAATMKTAENAE